MSFSDELGRELRAVGISGSRRARILDEIEDHLACDPSAQLGSPRDLAREFGDQLGTAWALRAAAQSFAALAVAGVLFGGAVLIGAHAVLAAGRHLSAIAWLARVVAAVASQIALAAGLLAGLRALQRRRRPVLAGAEARVIVLRAWVATGCGLLTMLGLGVIALAPPTPGVGAWHVYALVASGLGIVLLLATVPALLAAGRVTPTAAGGPGDVFDDLGPLTPRRLSGHPWWVAVLLSAAIAVALSAAGVIADDPYDGILRGFADGLFCLLCFATLGRTLGLRRPAVSAVESA